MTADVEPANGRPEVLALPRWNFSVPIIYTNKGGYVPIPPVCRRTGVTIFRQIQRLEDDAFFAPWVEELPVKTTQGLRITHCIHRRRFPMWVAVINTKRTTADIKEDVDAFKEDLADEAERLFYGVVDANPPTDLIPITQGQTIRQLHAAHTAHGMFLEQRMGSLEIDVGELREDMGDLKAAVSWGTPAQILRADTDAQLTTELGGQDDSSILTISFDAPHSGRYLIRIRQRPWERPELIDIQPIQD